MLMRGNAKSMTTDERGKGRISGSTIFVFIPLLDAVYISRDRRIHIIYVYYSNTHLSNDQDMIHE